MLFLVVYGNGGGSMKLAAIDLDGTLLNSKGHVTQENVHALRTYRNKGGIVAIATGRSIISLKDTLMSLEIMDYALTSNGALIGKIGPFSQVKKISLQMIEPSIVNKVLEFAKKMQVTIIASRETHDVTFSFSNQYLELDTPYGQQFYLSDKKYTSIDTESYLKLALTDHNHEKLNILQKLLTEVNISSVFSDKYFLEVTSKKVSKAESLKFLSHYLEINRSDIMAFGDQQNDLEMLRYSGVAIAMDNAVPSVKKYADWITKTNDESGVAFILNSI